MRVLSWLYGIQEARAEDAAERMTEHARMRRMVKEGREKGREEDE